MEYGVCIYIYTYIHYLIDSVCIWYGCFYNLLVLVKGCKAI